MKKIKRSRTQRAGHVKGFIQSETGILPKLGYILKTRRRRRLLFIVGIARGLSLVFCQYLKL